MAKWRKKSTADIVRDQIAEEGSALGMAVSGGDNALRVEAIENLDEIKGRLKSCETAGDVFADFSSDAARILAHQMFFSRNATERRQAATTLLNYGLGKPVDRIMSISMQTHGMDGKELDNRIDEMMSKLGYSGMSSDGVKKLMMDEESNDRRQPQGKGKVVEISYTKGRKAQQHEARKIRRESGVST